MLPHSSPGSLSQPAPFPSARGALPGSRTEPSRDKSQARPASKSYIPGVDGLRAVAVVLVVLYHANLAFPGGYVGVDVFFVISGYLITSIIQRDLAAGRFSLVNFWERRVRRILPALAAVVLATAIAGYFLFMPDELRVLGKTIIALPFMAANFFFWSHGNYFDKTSETNPLLHTWSLAVEEQFYLIFPVILLGFYRFCGNRWKTFVNASIIAGFLLGVSGAVFLVRIGAIQTSFYLLPARAWELLCGSVLAILPAAMLPRKGLLRGLLIAIGLAGVVAPALLYTKATPFPGLAAIPPCLGSALIIYALIGAAANEKPLFLERILSCKPMVFIGLISYSFYLWHVPVLVYMEQYFFEDPFSIPSKVGAVVLSFLLAILSWRFIETPFREKTVTPRQWQVFTFGITTSAVMILTGVLFDRFQGFPERLPPQAARYTKAAGDMGVIVQLTLKDLEAERFFVIGNKTSHRPTDILLWGDSHAMHLISAFDKVLAGYGLRGECASHSDTPPFFNTVVRRKYGLNEKAPLFSEEVIAHIQKHQIKRVILSAAWKGYLETLGTTRFKQAFKETVHRLEELGCLVSVVISPAYQRTSVPEFFLKGMLTGRTPEFPHTTRLQHGSEMEGMYQLVKEMPELRWVDLSTLLWDPVHQRYDYASGDVLAYRDKHHITGDAALKIYTPYLEKIMGPFLESAKESQSINDLQQASVQPVGN